MGTLQPCSQAVLRSLAMQLEAAGHGDRSTVIREASTHYGVSVQPSTASCRRWAG